MFKPIKKIGIRKDIIITGMILDFPAIDCYTVPIDIDKIDKVSIAHGVVHIVAHCLVALSTILFVAQFTFLHFCFGPILKTKADAYQ